MPTNHTVIQRAALYIRVSSEEQAMHGLSLDAQRATLIEYAKSHDMKIIGIYADEGITARKRYRNRVEFMRMLDAVKQNEIDIILFIKLDRWFRSVADYYEVQRILDAHNVQWITTEERYDTTSANGRLNLNIRLSVAQDESDRTSERIQFIFKDKLRRCEVVSGKVPRGYIIRDKKLCIDESSAKIVRAAFDYYEQHGSLKETWRYLNMYHNAGYKTYNSMRVLLSNERYIGRAHGINDFCPPIISQEQFFRVQKMLSVRSQRNYSQGNTVYLFSGLVFCAECGNRLAGHLISKRYIYYRCSKHEAYKTCPHSKSTSETYLENWLLENIESQFRAYNTNIIAHAKKNESSVDLVKIKAKLEKLKDLYLSDLIERDMYERDFLALQAQLKPKREQTPKPIDLTFLKNLNETYSSLSNENKRIFWRSILSGISIDNDNNLQAYPIGVYPLNIYTP